MIDPIRTSPERARVRMRDLAAAWALVGFILVAGILPGAIRTAKAEVVHAASAARCEVAMVLHAVPKMLQRVYQA